MTQIRVCLVDDQALFRAGIRMLVDSQPDLSFAGEAADGAEAVALAARARPDVVLMDVRMPVLDGISATERILADADRAGHAPPRVLVLTTFDADEYVYEAMRGGASGFLLKDVSPERLAEAVRTIAAGETLLAQSVTLRLIERFVRRPPGSAPRDELAPLGLSDGAWLRGWVQVNMVESEVGMRMLRQLMLRMGDPGGVEGHASRFSA